MKRSALRTFLAAALLLLTLGHAAMLWHLPLIEQLDAIFYDSRLRLTQPGGIDERIAIIDIDEASLAELGRWPWPRDRLAKLVDRLFNDYQVRQLGFDVVFAEADDSTGLPLLDQLAAGELHGDVAFHRALTRLRPGLERDQVLAKALAGRNVVLGYYFSGDEHSVATGALPAPILTTAALPASRGAASTLAVTHWTGYGGNLPRLQTAAGRAGHFNTIADPDGIVRRTPMLVEFAGNYYEALSLAMVRTLLQGPSVEPGIVRSGDGYVGLEWLDLPTPQGTLRLPVDANIAALIPYRGAAGSFPYYAAADVLASRLPADALQGRIVLLGTTAPGLVDLRSTPMGAAYPGVEVHANLIAGMLDGRLLQVPPYATGAAVLSVLLAGGLLLLLLPRLSPGRGTVLVLLLLLTLLGGNVLAWQVAGLVLPLAAPVLLVLILYGFYSAWGYFFEAQAKRRFADLFGQYVPPQLVERMALDPDRYSMAGQSAELSVLFSDIRDFTRIAESLPAKDLARLMNIYLDRMTAIVSAQWGTLDKYIGDAIMAFWGAPVADAEHARRTVLAALAMRDAMPAVNAELAAHGWPGLNIGIGINTGNMVVGDMGSTVRKAYTVIGDAVNLASRLESLAPRYGVPIVVGEATRQAAGEGLVWRELDQVRVKGKGQAVSIYEPLGLVDQVDGVTMARLARWQQALHYYRQSDWAAAAGVLSGLLAEEPTCQLYRLFSERVTTYAAVPPAPDWDGISSYDDK